MIQALTGIINAPTNPIAPSSLLPIIIRTGLILCEIKRKRENITLYHVIIARTVQMQGCGNTELTAGHSEFLIYM